MRMACLEAYLLLLYKDFIVIFELGWWWQQKVTSNIACLKQTGASQRVSYWQPSGITKRKGAEGRDVVSICLTKALFS